MPDDVPLPAVFVGYRTPPERDDDFIALDLLSDILGSGESSRLYQSLVYAAHRAGQASSWVDGRDGHGMFVAYAMAVPGTGAGELEDAIDKEIRRVARDGIGEAEMEKTRNRVEAAFYQSMQTMSHRADRLAHYALFHDDPAVIHSMLDRYRRCGAGDIRRAAERCVASDGRAVIHFVPRHDGAAAGAAPHPDLP
jgi:zinc protease